MDFKDQLFIIKNRIFEKRNIILIIILVIIFLIFYSCLTAIKVSVDNKREILKSDNLRTYYIYPDENQAEQIKNIEHVELVVNNKYAAQNNIDVKEFDSKKQKSTIYIKPLIKENDIEIKKGKGLNNKYEMVCPDTFYPYEYNEKMYKNFFLPKSKYLNKTITLKSENEDYEGKEIDLTIVGTFKNKYGETANTCYTDFDTFNEISSKYGVCSYGYDIEGNLVYEDCNEYTDYILRVDKRENNKKVEKELKNMNVQFDIAGGLDPTILNMVYTVPLFVSIIVSLLTILILYNFITKKNIKRAKNIGILKAMGYEDEVIIKLNINENIIITIISAIISFIIYAIVLNNLRYTLLAEVTFNNFILSIPYLYIILTLIVTILIIILIVKSNLKKIFKNSIQDMLTD